MRAALLSVALVACSGCCCGNALTAATDSQWEQAVRREKTNRQSYAMEAGTANVFRLEARTVDGSTVDSAEFTVLWPQPEYVLEGASPASAQPRRGELRTFGRLPVDPQTVTAEMLKAGHALEPGSYSFESLEGSGSQTLVVPAGGRGVLTLLRSCSARVVEHHDPVVKHTQGIINVPYEGDGETVWLEMQSAPCATRLIRPAR